MNQLNTQNNPTQLFYFLICLRQSPALLSRPWRGEPNFTHTAHIPTSPNGSRVTGHGSRIIENEPNFNRPEFTRRLCGGTKHANIANFTPKKVSVSHQLFHPFTHLSAESAHFYYYFYALFCTFCPFFQLLDLNALNSMYNKGLHNFLPQNTLYERSLPAVFVVGNNEKRTQFQKEIDNKNEKTNPI